MLVDQGNYQIDVVVISGDINIYIYIYIYAQRPHQDLPFMNTSDLNNPF